MKVVSIVEGDGEMEAFPILLRRLADGCEPPVYAEILKPIRVHRDQFINKKDAFNKKLQLAANKCGEAGWILILLDADDDCPVQLAADISARAAACVPHRAVSVVIAKREYEAWFIAAAASLDGVQGFVYDAGDTVDPERPRDAKGWMGDRKTVRGYYPIIDQPKFTARMDLALARERSRSFRKLCEEWDRRVSNG